MNPKTKKVMDEREKNASVVWKKDGDYYTGEGFTSGMVAYIVLPENHPDFNTNYTDLNPEVNGGLTFGDSGVFGWEYPHSTNDYRIKTHIKNALEYFRSREK